MFPHAPFKTFHSYPSRAHVGHCLLVLTCWIWRLTECGGHQLPTTFSSSHNRMILHSTKYRNLMNEPISLTIQQYQSNGSHCKISIRRDALGLRWFFVRLILFFIVAQCATIVFCYNKLVSLYKKMRCRFFISFFITTPSAIPIVLDISMFVDIRSNFVVHIFTC